MVESYWLIGQQIVEHEQLGEARADYGKGLLKELAMRLTQKTIGGAPFHGTPPI